jgi:hypothetical protein
MSDELLNETNKKLNICDDLTIEKNRNLIIIYTGIKVGSTSLVSSIRLSGITNYTVLHIHDEKMLEVLCGIKSVTINEIIKYNNRLGKNVYVIDIYRTPIEQKISQFFEKLATFHFNNSPYEINNYNVEKIIHRFNDLFPYFSIEDYYNHIYDI